MNRLHAICLAILISAPLSACGTRAPALPNPSPVAPPLGPWIVKLTQSGGFIAVSHSMRVSSDGQFTAQDARSGRSASGILPPASLSELERLLGRLPVGGGPSSPGTCSDCFVYDLELQSAGATTRIHTDDAALAESGAADVINLLRQLYDDALPSSP